MVMQLLITYFLWQAIFTNRDELFGYTQSLILTYILLSSLLRTFIMGTRTQDIGIFIYTGDLSNWLIRPISFLRFCISREIADKGINFLFATFEVIALFVILRPSIFIQTNTEFLLLTVISVIIGTIVFFSFSTLLSYFAFWTHEVWGPRFLSFILIEFFGGILFPLDILPKQLYAISLTLPFPYFIYFPLKLYLGQLSTEGITYGFTIGFFWMICFWLLTNYFWHKGLRTYTAHGR